jgi:cobalt/nickel transport system permease protein
VHHVVIERWSQGASLLHARDARAKVIVLLAFLIALATTQRLSPVACAGYAALAVAGILLGRLPLAPLLLRAAIVLPFSAAFAAFSLIAGEAPRAASLLVKSYLSAAAVLVLVGTTPLAKLLRGLESLGAPRLLTLVVQFLYRYLFVVSEQAQHMRLAALCRGAGRRRLGFRAAAGALAVLFARSYGRAEGIHQAMLARGFAGRTRLLSSARIGARDVLFLAAGLSLVLALRLSLGVLCNL